MTTNDNQQSPVKVFLSYSHKDESYKDELETHLTILQRQGLVSAWHDRKILPGRNWEQEIDSHLESSDLILLLISSDFIASDYCYGIELKKALDRHERNDAKVVPIIIRPIEWQGEPISRLQALPKDANPISTWQNRDEGWIDVVKGIRKIVHEVNVAKNRVGQNHGLLSLRDHLKEEFRKLERRYDNPSGCGGISTGYKHLDSCIDGLDPADFIVIAARPLIGKTDFLINISAKVGIDNSIPVAFFSMKLPTEQITKRLLCSKANVNSHNLNRGYLVDSDWPKITYAAGALAEAKIFIDDSPTMSVDALKQKALQLQKETGLGLIVIDSLHHFAGAQELSSIPEITRALKAVAKELKLPILASAQVSRDVELRYDKRPSLKDLDQWHSLVEDADVIAFLYYEKAYDEYCENPNKADLIVDKNRKGPVGWLEFGYKPEFNLFVETQTSKDKAQPENQADGK